MTSDLQLAVELAEQAGRLTLDYFSRNRFRFSPKEMQHLSRKRIEKLKSLYGPLLPPGILMTDCLAKNLMNVLPLISVVGLLIL